MALGPLHLIIWRSKSGLEPCDLDSCNYCWFLIVDSCDLDSCNYFFGLLIFIFIFFWQIEAVKINRSRNPDCQAWLVCRGLWLAVSLHSLTLSCFQFSVGFSLKLCFSTLHSCNYGMALKSEHRALCVCIPWTQSYINSNFHSM